MNRTVNRSATTLICGLALGLAVVLSENYSGTPLAQLGLISTAHAAPPGVHHGARRTTRSGRSKTTVRRSGNRRHRSVSVDVTHRHRPRVGAVAAGIVIGTRIATLPRGCTTVYSYDITYHHCGGTYYRPYYEGTQVVYVVVEAP
ncbi:MAG: hypothetical protein ACR2QW_13890 [bacterium]